MEINYAMSEIKPVIYIVDDEPSIGRALGRLLKSQGYRSKIFTSAEDFLKAADIAEIGSLILDIKLSGMGGLELQQELIKKGHNIPIIFITGHGDKELERKVMYTGALGYLEKPFDEKLLLNMLDIALKTKGQNN